MKTIMITTAFLFSESGWFNCSELELVVKFGKNFDETMKEIESDIPYGYISIYQTKVFIDNVLDDELSAQAEQRLINIIESDK